jgi:hypothetical protein
MFTYKYVSSYLKMWKTAEQYYKDNPQGTLVMGRLGRELDHDGFKRWVIEALDKRINDKVLPVTGRKYSDMYQTELMRDVRAIRSHSQDRVIVRYLGTKEMQHRYNSIVWKYNED